MRERAVSCVGDRPNPPFAHSRPGDLVREARRDLLPTDLVEAPGSLPERSYTSRWDVLHRTSIAEALPISV